MDARRLLYLTQHQIFAYRWQGGNLSPDGEFLAEDAASSFAQYLAERPQALFSIVVNIAEEGFRSDTIPFLQSKDRAAVVSRRLGQNFLGAPLSLAISHGYESGSRKNERLLLAALTSAEHLDPWMEALEAAGARVQGIYSLPLLSESLCRRIGLKIERGVLVTVQDNTVRQSFFNGGRLMFSRLAPLLGGSISDIASSIASEANRFQQYLLSQRMIARGDRLVAYVLAHPQVVPAIDAARFNDGIDVSIHDIGQAAQKLGLKARPGDSRTQALFLQCAVVAPPAQQFASAELRQPYRIWQLGRAILAVGTLVFVSCLIFSFKVYVELEQARSEATQRGREADSMQQSYNQALSSLPPIPMSNDVLRQVVDRVDAMRKKAGSPAPAFKHLSTALDAIPQIEVTMLDWLAPGSKSGEVSGNAGAPRPGAGSESTETLLVKGTVNLGAQGSPRLMVATFDDFIRRLSGPKINVTTIQSPINLNVNASRSQKADEGVSSARMPRPFSLQIEYLVQP